ncbi:MAG: hypothetical protein JW860_13905 [Sedimentisphaerales bacterium]|nr:hypothetical protein [Sedimentisphaerales bacterium]
MASHNYYILSALPGLGDFGSEPLISTTELLEYAEHIPGLYYMLEIIFLSDDLLQYQSFGAHEIGEEEVDLTVMTMDQVRGESPLPVFLAGVSSDNGPRAFVDRLWESYFHEAARIADKVGSDFLKYWVGYEVALRNGLAEARAKALNLEAGDYLVAADLSDPDVNFDSVINEWSGSASPLAGLGALDRSRWQWLVDHDEWFSFEDDELGAYAAKLLLLQRWHRINHAGQTTPAGVLSR